MSEMRTDFGAFAASYDHPLAHAERLAQRYAGASCAIALVALSGWLVGARFLAGQWGIYLPMAPSTALALLVLGGGVFCHARWPSSDRARYLALASAGVAVSMGLLILGEFVAGYDSGVERALARTNEMFGHFPLGRMSPVTALTLLLQSGALMLMLDVTRWRGAPSLAALLALLAAVINLVVLVGYGHGLPVLYGGSIVPVAVPTALAFALLGVGQVNLLLPRIQSLHAWRRGTLRGDLVRAVLPAVFLLIILDGWADVAIRASVRSVNLAVWHAVTALASGVLIVVVVGWIARRTGDALERTEEALIASEARYRRLFESAKDGILILDAETGMTVDVNPFLIELLGFSRESFFGKKVWDLGFFEDIIANQAGFTELQREDYVRYRDKPLKTNDGRRIDVEFVSNAYMVNDRKVIQCNMRDITDLKRAEVEAARLGAQLQQAQRMESVGRLAGGVAHDFNNMLGVILGLADLALVQVGSGNPLHGDLQQLRGAALRSADLTRQLLAFAREQTIAPKVLNLNDAVGGMLKMLHRLIGENIDLNWKPGADLWQVKVDPSQVDQIMVNLCVNARDAISGVGRMTIGTENSTLDKAFRADHAWCVPGEYVRLTVSDDGCGMDTETLAHIFEPFFTTKVMGRGTGLGLATVYGIVKQNDGFIDVDSEPGQGTTFAIYLPRHADAAEPGRTEGAAASLPRSHETVLLVEDEPTFMTVTRRMLEQQGYTVVAASIPGEALRLAQEHAGDIHLLLTDVVMPEMNGRDLAGKLLSVNPHLKCLFMSGYPADVIANHGVLEEGVQFLQKPFSTADLTAKIRDVLDADE